MLVQFNDISLDLFRLGEKAVLIRSVSEVDQKDFRALSELLLHQKPEGLDDVIVAYDSIAVTFKDSPADLNGLAKHLNKAGPQETSVKEPRMIQLPVCYEMGMDWKDVEQNTGLTKSEVVRIHSEARYEVAMLGFLPGFIYLNGLPESLFCPRKKVPRTAVPSGSVGIGGDHTGMYSLSSPGGWQIIGLSPVQIFNVNEDPPVKIRPGDRISFLPISEKEYHRRIRDES